VAGAAQALPRAPPDAASGQQICKL